MWWKEWGFCPLHYVGYSNLQKWMALACGALPKTGNKIRWVHIVGIHLRGDVNIEENCVDGSSLRHICGIFHQTERVHLQVWRGPFRPGESWRYHSNEGSGEYNHSSVLLSVRIWLWYCDCDTEGGSGHWVSRSTNLLSTVDKLGARGVDVGRRVDRNSKLRILYLMHRK